MLLPGEQERELQWSNAQKHSSANEGYCIYMRMNSCGTHSLGENNIKQLQNYVGSINNNWTAEFITLGAEMLFKVFMKISLKKHELTLLTLNNKLPWISTSEGQSKAYC